MPDTKISNDPAAGTLTGTELIPGVQSGANVRINAVDIAALGGGTPAVGSVVNASVASGAAIAQSKISGLVAGLAAKVPLPGAPPAYTINGSAPTAGYTLPAALGSFSGTLLTDALTAISALYARCDLLEGIIRGEVVRDQGIGTAT